MNIPVITPAFGAVIGWMYKNICFENYMFTLVLFAVFVKLLLFPLGIKQQKTSLKQAKVRPMETAIRKKYAGRNDKATQQKMQQEIMELYKTENVNPAAGCLPLLIQMPILFGLYSVIVNPLKYIAGLSNEVIDVLNNAFGMRANYDINIIKAITDMGTSVKPAIIDNINAGLSSANVTSVNANGLITQISDLTNHFTVFGIDLTVNPTLALNIYIIIPILTFVFAFFSTKIIRKFTYQTQQAQETQSSMAMMDWTMPLLSVWISFSLPSAIAIYWMLQNILSAVQQIVLYKMFPIPPVTEEELREAELKLKGKSSEKARNVVLEDPDYSSPIYEEVPEPEFEERTSISVSSGPNGLTNKIKRRLKETNKPLKARRKI